MKLCIVPFVTIVEFVFFGNRLDQKRTLGIAVVVAGIFFVLNPGGGAASSSVRPTFMGLLVAIISGKSPAPLEAPLLTGWGQQQR